MLINVLITQIHEEFMPFLLQVYLELYCFNMPWSFTFRISTADVTKYFFFETFDH